MVQLKDYKLNKNISGYNLNHEESNLKKPGPVAIKLPIPLLLLQTVPEDGLSLV